MHTHCCPCQHPGSRLSAPLHALRPVPQQFSSCTARKPLLRFPAPLRHAHSLPTSARPPAALPHFFSAPLASLSQVLSPLTSNPAALYLLGALALVGLVLAIKRDLDTPRRTYRGNVGDEYDRWTQEGIVEYYWGEHIHLGYYNEAERAAGVVEEELQAGQVRLHRRDGQVVGREAAQTDFGRGLRPGRHVAPPGSDVPQRTSRRCALRHLEHCAELQLKVAAAAAGERRKAGVLGACSTSQLNVLVPTGIEGMARASHVVCEAEGTDHCKTAQTSASCGPRRHHAVAGAGEAGHQKGGGARARQRALPGHGCAGHDVGGTQLRPGMGVRVGRAHAGQGAVCAADGAGAQAG